MKLRLRSLTLVVAAISFLVVSAGTWGVADAASSGLGVTPRKDYTIHPGDSISDTIFIRNLSLNDDLIVSIRPIDFGAQNETGTPALQLNEDAPMPPWSLKPFLSIESSYEIEAGGTANIPVEIAIPEDQGAGSYYVAIEYRAENAETGQQVALTASTATLVFVTVPGDADERLEFRQFGAYVPGRGGLEGSFRTLFTGAEPQMMAYRLENLGNVAQRPAGSIIIQNMFGRTVVEIEKANPKDQLALIGQTRRFEVCLRESVVSEPGNNNGNSQRVECTDPNLWPGRYTASLAVFYGMGSTTSHEIAAEAVFWYIPWWFVITVLAVIAVISAVGWLVVRNIRLSKGRRFRHKRR